MSLIPSLTFCGYALGVAAALIAVAWGLEAVVGHQVGFYFNIVVAMITAAGGAYAARRELTDCLLSDAPDFQRCEWSAVFFWTVVAMTITMLAPLIASAVALRWWSSRSMKLPT
jgi:hypothetical protein